MPTGTFNADSHPPPAPSLRILGPLLPLFPFQPALAHAARYAARRRPEIFDRLGEHAGKSFLIDPVNLPFPILLRPDPDRLSLSAVRRDPDDATARLAEAGLDAPFCNGFHHGTAGHEWVQPPAADTPNTGSVQ